MGSQGTFPFFTLLWQEETWADFSFLGGESDFKVILRFLVFWRHFGSFKSPNLKSACFYSSVWKISKIQNFVACHHE